MQVNDQLDKRRALLNKRLAFVQICLQVTGVVTLINIASSLFGIKWLFVPYSLSCVHFGLDYALHYLKQGNTARFVLLIAFCLLFFVLFTVACFKMKDQASWATVSTVLLTVDLIVTLALAFMRLEVIFYVVDVVLHCFAIIQSIRGKRASHGLAVLPEYEMEGDPFEEFQSK